MKYFKTSLLLFLIALSALAHGCRMDCSMDVRNREKNVAGKSRIVRLERVVDGDTIKLTTGERVRYIGVNTPELAKDGRAAEHFAERATECNRDLLGNGKLKLVFGKEAKDKYGRLLAYVYAGPDFDTFVNAELIKRGCARTLSIPPNTSHANELHKLERQARNKRRGLWAD